MTTGPIAFSPGSVTGFFVPSFGPTPSETVSRGLAFCLTSGVTAAIEPSGDRAVLLNGQPINLLPVLEVLRELAPQPVTIHLETPLPLGCGFGVSAAGALSAAFALNRYFDLGRSRNQLGLIAHTAEVTHQTGVGDVAAQLCGGIVDRHCLNGPFDALRMDHVPACPLHYCSFGPLSTRDVLSSTRMAAALQTAGTSAIEWLASNFAGATIPSLLERSRQFAEETGLLTNPSVRDAIQAVRAAGGSATMIMLGHAVLATIPAATAGHSRMETGTAAPGSSERWIPCQIDPLGTRLI